MTRRPLLAVGLALALPGCPRGGAAHAPHASAADGLTIAIYTGAAPTLGAVANGPVAPIPPTGDATAGAAGTTSVAVVDDLRTIEVDAGGVVHLDAVADGLELASLIVEPLDGKRFAVRTCARDAGAATGARAATIVAADGARIEGTLRAPGAASGAWIVEDGQGRDHFLAGVPDEVILHDAASTGVHCEVDAAPGRHRVRLAYATDDLSWRAAYRVDVAGGVATIQPTFTIAGSGVIGARRADVSLLTGRPGGDVAPRLAWSGTVDLGSDDVAVEPAVRTVPVELAYLYRGAITTADENQRLSYWRSSSNNDVWLALGLGAKAAAAVSDLPGGPALFSIARDAAGDEVGSGGSARQALGRWPDPEPDARDTLALPLWPARDLVGMRERRTLVDDGQRIVEQYLFGVSNHGTGPATVWIEEELRAGAARRELRKRWPVKPSQHGEVLRFEVSVRAGRTERVGFEAEYHW